MGAIDAERFEGIFDDHSAAILAYLLRRTRRPAAEDALSETFLIAWRRRAELPAEPRPWLYAVARNVLANQRRVDGRRAALVQRLRRDRTAGGVGGRSEGAGDQVGAALPQGTGELDASPLMLALRSLAAPDREVLLLDAWEQLSSTEGGEVLGCTAEAYRARLHRAKKRLKSAVGDDHSALMRSSRATTTGDPDAAPPSAAEATR